MAEHFRISKLEKFIAKQVQFMEYQQRTIESFRKQHATGSIDADKIMAPVIANQTAMYNYTFDLCREFGLEMPHVLGVTPR